MGDFNNFEYDLLIQNMITLAECGELPLGLEQKLYDEGRIAHGDRCLIAHTRERFERKSMRTKELKNDDSNSTLT